MMMMMMMIIIIIIISTGNFSKLFRKYLNKIPGKQNMKEMQRTAILGTEHILRKVLI
jgi:hypothetical protein